MYTLPSVQTHTRNIVMLKMHAMPANTESNVHGLSIDLALFIEGFLSFLKSVIGIT